MYNSTKEKELILQHSVYYCDYAKQALLYGRIIPYIIVTGFRSHFNLHICLY